ncbi:MAG: hypothetical protein HYR88_06000 [Verrucomicrobia bacterium]|nr:hypothetical protein [Verrucomicrobiota bacterium]MBI3867673.1 hypothetical protein [Verrucomicrobiota bacterium]
MSRKSPFRNAVEKIAVPWATQHGFARASAYVFTRPSGIPDVLEVIELQKSVKRPFRTFTINLGLFHPQFTTTPPPAPDAVASVKCARRIRVGWVMPKSFWSRVLVWLRYGNGWHFWQVFPGDFWWSYRDSEASLTASLSHALSQVERYGLPWFGQFSSLRSTDELFDRSPFAAH